ncbi:MAG: RsmB/NOP family class I SAM-dependent RNA methyltransferase [Treponema sp.]
MAKRKEKENKLTGEAGFNAYYAELFGERWQPLKASLTAEGAYATLNCGGKEAYFLDAASVWAAAHLPLTGAAKILDLCAAPGGKSLVLASLMEEEATLDCNERSFERKKRLVKVCDSCLPESIRSRIRISCSDGAKWCLTKSESYERILLDAPCSSERHVLNSPAHLCKWSPSRIKSLAVEQWALLSGAYRLLSVGGYILYSTCALSPDENDKIIARLLKKFSGAVKIDICESGFPAEKLNRFCSLPAPPRYERTEHGYHILPDRQDGAGPIWFSLIKKLRAE